MSTDPSLRFQRQLDLLPLERLDIPVSVIGAGAVGSFVTLTLAKMGLSAITVFDDDVVDEHNLPNQFFRELDVGRAKVEALAELVQDFTGTGVRAVPRRFDGEASGGEALEGLVVAAVDSMASRRAVWDAVRTSTSVQRLLDARMGGQVALVHALNPSSIGDSRRYEATLHSDEEAMPEPCSARAIAYTVLAVSAAIARLVRRHLVGEALPFLTVQDNALGHFDEVA